MAERVGEKERFVWPPRLVPEEAVRVEAPEPEPTQQVDRSREGILVRAERALLDPSAEPIRRRAARVGWAPDEPGVYCDRCGRSVGPHEEDEMGCSVCLSRRLKWGRVVRLGAYNEPLSRWIQEVKFTRWSRLGMDLGRWLGESIQEQRVFGDNGETDGTVVVAMPTSLRRRWSRGIDHAWVIARGVGLELGVPIVRALGRAHRPSQRRVAVSRRASNVRGTFVCRAKKAVYGRNVVLVDDVMTTGATAHEATKVLLGECGAASVVVGVLGVTGEDA